MAEVSAEDLSESCPTCGAAVGRHCRDGARPYRGGRATHGSRRRRVAEVAAEREGAPLGDV